MGEAIALMSAIQATTQLVEQSFRTVGRIRTAYLRDKSLADVLTRHKHELESIKSILVVVEDIKEFQTPQVIEQVHQLHKIHDKLTKLLDVLEPGTRSKACRVLHQLAEGSSDENKLASIMSELGDVKTTLILRIQAVHVGVSRGIGTTLVANTVLIEQINETLRDHIKDCEGLRIARLLEGRSPPDDGLIPLTRADIRAMRDHTDRSDSEDSSEGTLVDDSDLQACAISVKTERMILQNVSREQALQINGPVGADMWEKVHRLVIKDNVAEGQSIQVNYPTTMEALKLYTQIQARNIERGHRPVGRKRHDSMDL